MIMNDSIKDDRVDKTGSMPQMHMIPIPEQIKNRAKDNGASSYQGKVNHPDSRYYKFNDYYNMTSDETLHILTHFETYQQTTEYTCGAASALMVLNHMGHKKYNEDVLGALMETAPNVGTSVENMADFFDVIGWNVFCHADTTPLWCSEKDLEKAIQELRGGEKVKSQRSEETYQSLSKYARNLVDEARNGLMEKWGFTEIQAAAIVEMRLRQLTGMERQKLQEEYDEKLAFIQRCKEILGNHDVLMSVIKDEIIDIRDKYGDDRRTAIKYDAANFRIEDTIPNDQVVITISHLGYIKRTLLSEYRTQNRGGVGSKGSSVRNEDFVEHIFTATNHNYLLLFTEQGRCFWMRAFEVPEGGKDSKGRAILNLINLGPDDKVKAYVNVESLSDPEYLQNHYIIMCTKNGIIKKTNLEAYSRPRTKGIIAVGIREGDELLNACLTDGNCDMLLATKYGKVVRCPEDEIRDMGRGATGVKGITLQDENDSVISLLCVSNKEDDILVVSEQGFGKRSSLDQYRITHRGGKGVSTLNVTEKTGNLIAISNISEDEDLMIINRSGITIRLRVSDIRVLGRTTQGFKLINLRGKDYIASITKVPAAPDEEENGAEVIGEGTSQVESQDTPENPGQETSENEDQNN